MSLGTWQIKRLEWKENLLFELEKAYQYDYRDYASLNLPQKPQHHTYIKATLVAKINNENCFFIGPRTHDGKNGFHLMCNLKLEKTKNLLINLGWLEASDKNIDIPVIFTSTLSQSEHRYNGALRPPSDTNVFTPENQPLNDRWYYINLEQIKEHFKLENIEPLILYNHSPLPSETKIIAHEEQIALKNDHMGYAIFWYTGAIILLIFYYLRFFYVKMD
jgi:surfeit locus 1 family protein